MEFHLRNVVALKECIFNPILVKSKWLARLQFFQFFYIIQLVIYNIYKESTVSKTNCGTINKKPFISDNFHMEHPIQYIRITLDPLPAW